MWESEAKAIYQKGKRTCLKGKKGEGGDWKGQGGLRNKVNEQVKATKVSTWLCKQTGRTGKFRNIRKCQECEESQSKVVMMEEIWGVVG